MSRPTESTVNICLLLPDVLGTSSDSGNATVLLQRLRWRDIAARILTCTAVQNPSTSCDIYLLGGGEDTAQRLAARWLRDHRALRNMPADTAVTQAVCAGLQIFGRTMTDPGGTVHLGADLLDLATCPGRAPPGHRTDHHRLRLLAGMVADNRPWRLVPHLSSATAAAAATAAYGLITTTFWDMADSLSTLRLALISVVAVVAMVIWLLAYNHLWTRAGSRVEKEKMVLYNLSTMVTLSIGVACMYVILYFVTLLGAAVLIDSRYLQSRLGHPVSVADYARLVWLTCSVGIVAGAVGSSLESEEAVRQATYSTREQQRHKKTRDQSSQDQDRAR
jgi:CobB/CobQ-like glutamine amidotransferase-like protein